LPAPLVYGVLVFTIVTIGGGILPLALNKASKLNLTAIETITFLVNKAPEVVAYTIPMGLLFAILLSLGRMASDSEWVALRAGGINLIQIAKPILILSVFVCLFNLLLTDTVIPKGQAVSEGIIERAKARGEGPRVKENVSIPFYEGGYMKRLLFAKESQGRKLLEVSMAEYEQGKLDRILFAKEAVWDGGETWRFQNGIMHKFGQDQESILMIRFEKEILKIDIKPVEIQKTKKDPKKMTMRELSRYIEVRKKQGISTRKLEIEWHMKTTLPFSGLIYAILGIPLSLRRGRSGGAGISFGICLLVIFVYYVVLSIGTSMGSIGAINPVLAAWLPNILIGSFAVFLAYKRLAA